MSGAPPRLETAFIRRKAELSPRVFSVDLTCPDIARSIRPGQFVMVALPARDTLLRRPFGVHGVLREGGTIVGIRLLIRRVGRGTGMIGALDPGASLSLMGPCGTGFTLPAAGEVPVLVAAGIGCAPLGALLDEIGAERAIAYVGGRTEADLVWRPEVCRCAYSTDDGSMGFAGTLLELVVRDLPGMAGGRLRWYACGPVPFLALLAGELRGNGWPVEAAFDRRMACGFGVCLGCAVPVATNEGIVRVRACVEGPVFDALAVEWEELVENVS